jgi:hypothetical protein
MKTHPDRRDYKPREDCPGRKAGGFVSGSPRGTAGPLGAGPESRRLVTQRRPEPLESRVCRNAEGEQW